VIVVVYKERKRGMQQASLRGDAYGPSGNKKGTKNTVTGAASLVCTVFLRSHHVWLMMMMMMMMNSMCEWYK
jgi:hypothetical protein